MADTDRLSKFLATAVDAAKKTVSLVSELPFLAPLLTVMELTCNQDQIGAFESYINRQLAAIEEKFVKAMGQIEENFRKAVGDIIHRTQSSHTPHPHLQASVNIASSSDHPPVHSPPAINQEVPPPASEASGEQYTPPTPFSQPSPAPLLPIPPPTLRPDDEIDNHKLQQPITLAVPSTCIPKITKQNYKYPKPKKYHDSKTTELYMPSEAFMFDPPDPGESLIEYDNYLKLRTDFTNHLQLQQLPYFLPPPPDEPITCFIGRKMFDEIEDWMNGIDRSIKVIRKGFYETKNVEHKGQVDLVTETDKACEDLVFNHLKQQFPTHKFIGEETTAANGASELTDDPTWIVDPLDGTTNFVHGFPFVCVSIGLTIGKVPVVGVVYNPIMDELFTGIRGQGAFLNGNPIKVSNKDELVKSILATEVGTKRDQETVDITTNRINSLLFKVRSLRMSGSCALNLCGIACGRLDLFYECGYGGAWDITAGVVIVEEAGGVVFDPSGKDFDITVTRIAASNPSLKSKFIEALKQAES